MIGSRIMAVGDVHGQYQKLKTLMRRVRFDPAQDILVFLGDLIDRGPESLECFDYVMHLQKQHPESVVCLMGKNQRVGTAFGTAGPERLKPGPSRRCFVFFSAKIRTINMQRNPFVFAQFNAEFFIFVRFFTA